jgi:hypothetical protein
MGNAFIYTYPDVTLGVVRHLDVATVFGTLTLACKHLRSLVRVNVHWLFARIPFRWQITYTRSIIHTEPTPDGLMLASSQKHVMPGPLVVGPIDELITACLREQDKVNLDTVVDGGDHASLAGVQLDTDHMANVTVTIRKLDLVAKLFVAIVTRVRPQDMQIYITIDTHHLNLRANVYSDLHADISYAAGKEYCINMYELRVRKELPTPFRTEIQRRVNRTTLMAFMRSSSLDTTTLPAPPGVESSLFAYVAELQAKVLSGELPETPLKGPPEDLSKIPIWQPPDEDLSTDDELDAYLRDLGIGGGE